MLPCPQVIHPVLRQHLRESLSACDQDAATLTFLFCCYPKIPFQKKEPNSCLLYQHNDYCVQAVLLQGLFSVSVLSDLQEILGLVT